MVWKKIKQLKVRPLLKLIPFCIKQPLFVIPTIKASVKCMKICTIEYGSSHHKSNKANAFRHALWSVLIIKKCTFCTSKVTKAIHWTNRITTWHETFSVNTDLEKYMDLHNNEVGRNFYYKIGNLSEEEMVVELKKMADNAVKINTLSQKKMCENTLVYIFDEF